MSASKEQSAESAHKDTGKFVETSKRIHSHSQNMLAGQEHVIDDF